jgi:hypothetical protein
MTEWYQDPWIASHSIVTPAKLHAQGVLTKGWNLCEYWTGAIFTDALGVPERIGIVITHDLGDITVWNKIIDVAKARQLSDKVIEELAHASKVYDRCRSNRNQFVHASTVGVRNADGSILSLGRRKGPTLEVTGLNDSLNRIRQVVAEINALSQYLRHLCLAVHAPDERSWPLPKRPALPEFVWTPPPRTLPKPKRPPRSSLA